MKSYKTTLKTLMSVPIVAAVCFSASIAQASDMRIFINNTVETNIYVKAKNKQYIGIAKNQHPLGITFRAHIDAKTYPVKERRFNSWKAGLILQKYGHTFTPDLNSGAHTDNGVYSESYTNKPRRKRPRVAQKTVDLRVSPDKLNGFATNVCNTHANNLRNQGISDTDIFKQNRSVRINYKPIGDASTISSSTRTFFSSGVEHNIADINIVCMKAPVQLDTPSELQTSSGVTDASLNIIEQSTLGGSCKVNLSTVIKTNLPDTKVRYRFEHTNGNKSDIKTVTTSHSKTAMDAHWYDVPLNPNGSEAASVRIVGVSHDFQSDWKSYNMTCNSPTTNKVSLVTKPTVKLDLQPTHNILYKGMYCPTKVKVTATLTSPKAFSGTGTVKVKNRNSGFTTHNVDLNPNTAQHYYETVHLKPWSGNTITVPVGKGGSPNKLKANPDDGRINELVSNAVSIPPQRFEIRYVLKADQKTVIKTPFKAISISCTAPSQQVNPNLPTGNHKGLKAPDKEEVTPFQVKPKNLQLKQKAPQQQKLNVIPSKLYQKSRSTGATND